MISTPRPASAAPQDACWTTNQLMKHLSTSRLLHLAPATGNFLLACLITVLTEVASHCLSLITNLSLIEAAVNIKFVSNFLIIYLTSILLL